MGRLAAIDIGSYTGRLLIAEEVARGELFRRILRERAYIHLAQDFDCSSQRINPRAVERCLKVLKRFRQLMEVSGVERAAAVCTGVMRRDRDRKRILAQIHQETGIQGRVISGDEEALLTARGVEHSLGLDGNKALLFDLGGWSTDFFWKERWKRTCTVEVGALGCKDRFFRSDPPKDEEILSLVKYAERMFAREIGTRLSKKGRQFLIGTGGTATTLAAMIHGIEKKDITPERMDGLVVKRHQIKALFDELKGLSLEERLKIRPLDRGRAEVIVSGTAAAIALMDTLGFPEMTVSLSDLLEGVIISQLEEKSNGEP